MSSDDFNGYECIIAMFPRDKQAEQRDGDSAAPGRKKPTILKFCSSTDEIVDSLPEE